MTTLLVSDNLSHFIRAVGWTLIHSLWQAAIAALLAILVLWLTGKSRPAKRYNILLGLFVLLPGVVAVTFLKEYQHGIAATSTGVGDLQLNGPPTDYGDIYILSHETRSYLTALEEWIDRHIDLIVAFWLLACCIQSIRLVSGAAHVRRLKTSATLLPHEWQQSLQKLSKRLNITYPVMTLESARVKVPVVAGVLKPFILLPVGLLTNIPFEQIESIFLHELAHIKRRDHIINVLQVMGESVLFFNPAFMWLSSLLREEREACCDALAVSESASSSAYIEALVSFQTYAGSIGRESLAFAGKRNYLLKRVKRILYNENKKINVMEKVILFAGFAAICLSPAFFSASAKPVTAIKTAAVQQVTDTLPLLEEGNTQNKKATGRREARRAEKKAEEARVHATEAKKEAKAAKKAAEDHKAKANQDIQTTTDVNVNIDQKMTPEIKLKVDNAMKQAQISLEQSKVALNQAKYQLEQTKINRVNLLQMKQQMQLVDEQMQKLNLQKNVLVDDNELNGIINFLMQKNIIKSKENLSFRLDNDELIVNDEKQPASLHSELKEKYISDPGDYYDYKNAGGSTNISIRHND
jgi:beta-lactamase regulating signal transducer with metallopeptidase domain